MKLSRLPPAVLLVAASPFAACSKEPASRGGHDHGHDAMDAQHAPAGAVPGSYEDWCGGHGVPESKCTRCDPSLVAAFKATNDWCSEHGLPESQCPKCNPGLRIVRPPKPEGK